MGNACRCDTETKNETVVAETEPAFETKGETVVADARTSFEAAPAAAEQPTAPVEPEGPKFTVAIVGARGLRNADWFPGTGKSDCYLELKTGETLHHTTKVINDSLDPLWFEECEIMELNDGDDLEFYVYDKDVVTSEKLGVAKLESKDFSEGFNGELTIEDAKNKEQAYLRIKIKKGKEDYPKGPEPEFKLSVQRESKEKSFGLDVDLQNGVAIYVKAIKDGPFKEYNDTAEKELMRKGDFIVKVNDATTLKDMFHEFQDALKADVVVRRNIYQTIVLEKAEDKEPLGMTFPSNPVGEFLAIRAISEEGAAAKYNASAEDDLKVQAGDHIVSVAGQKGQAVDLLANLEKQSGKFQLIVERPVALEAEEGAVAKRKSFGARWFFGA